MNLDELAHQARACRLCRDNPSKLPPLPQEARPVFQVSETARICIAGQAPGNLAHTHAKPFFDPSGKRLRSWLGVDDATFYDSSLFTILPMGFCFPGYDEKGGDKPPRPECAPKWRAAFFERLPNIRLILTIGQYAQRWHLKEDWQGSLTATVERWQTFLERSSTPLVLPLPHPSWRNNTWLRRNPWFEAELVPVLQAKVQDILEDAKN